MENINDEMITISLEAYNRLHDAQIRVFILMDMLKTSEYISKTDVARVVGCKEEMKEEQL